jgi:hypothetical protein
MNTDRARFRWGTAAPWLIAAVFAAVVGFLLLLGLTASMRVLWTDGRTLPFLRQGRKYRFYEREQRRPEFEALAALIPPEAAVSLPLNLLNPIYPFAERRSIAFVPNRSDLADYIVFDTRTRFFGGHKEPGLDETLRRFRDSHEHASIYDNQGLIAFRRRRRAVDDSQAFERLWNELGPAG